MSTTPNTIGILDALLASLPDDDQALEAVALEFARRKAQRDTLGKHTIDGMCNLAMTRLNGLAAAIDEVGHRWQHQQDKDHDFVDSLSAGGGADGLGSRPTPSPTLPPALAEHAWRYTVRELDALEVSKHLVGVHRTLRPPQSEHDELMAQRDAQWLREQQGPPTPHVSLGNGSYSQHIDLEA